MIALLDQPAHVQPRLVTIIRGKEREAGAWTEREVLRLIVSRVGGIGRDAGRYRIAHQYVIAPQIARARESTAGERSATLLGHKLGPNAPARLSPTRYSIAIKTTPSISPRS